MFFQNNNGSNNSSLPNLSQILPKSDHNTIGNIMNLPKAKKIEYKNEFLTSMLADVSEKKDDKNEGKKEVKNPGNFAPREKAGEKERNLNDLNGSFTISDGENDSKNNSAVGRINDLKVGLGKKTPHEFISIEKRTKKNITDSISVIQNFINKKDIDTYYTFLFSKINLIKWLKVYKLLTGKEIQSISYILNHLKRQYTINSKSSLILCEVLEVGIIDCCQILEVIDADLSKKKIILTKKVKRRDEDFGKIKLINENFINQGELIMFKKSKVKEETIGGEDYIELDVKDVQIITPFGKDIDSEEEEEE